MAYYMRPSFNRGDYYRGDYYRGDPGFLSDVGHFLGGAAKAAFRVGTGLVTGYLAGGLKGAVAGAAGGAVEATVQGSREELLRSGGGETALTPELRAAHAAALARSGAAVAPGGKIIGPAGPGLMLPGPRGGARRVHPNRSTYVTRGGGTSRWPQSLTVHPKGTELVPSRRMNVGNARALRRSIRRLRGFAKLARKVLAVSRHYKHAGVRGVRRTK